MKTPIEQWIEDNFDRESRSMSDSCQTVTYVAKSDSVPPCPDNVRKNWIRPQALAATLISVWALLTYLLITQATSWRISTAVIGQLLG